MNLKLSFVLAAAAFCFSIAGSEAVTLSGGDGMQAIQSEAVKVSNV